VAALAVEVVAARVWVVDDTGFPKNGKASPCVSRQYCGTVGKVSNCQIAVSVHAATAAASAMLGARLFVPQSWDQTCLPDPDDPDAAIVNEHARRLHAEASTMGKDGAKKPHVRKTLPGPGSDHRHPQPAGRREDPRRAEVPTQVDDRAGTAWQRLEKLLEDSLIKVSSVASTMTTLSIRDMLEALIDGERGTI
jgi:hypothetical protein